MSQPGNTSTSGSSNDQGPATFLNLGLCVHLSRSLCPRPAPSLARAQLGSLEFQVRGCGLGTEGREELQALASTWDAQQGVGVQRPELEQWGCWTQLLPRPRFGPDPRCHRKAPETWAALSVSPAG